MTLRANRSRSRSGSSTELLRNAANGSSRILTDPASLQDASETSKLYDNNVMATNPPPTPNNLDSFNSHTETDVKINLNNLPGKEKHERQALNKSGSEPLPICISFSPSSRGIHLWCGTISLVVVYHMWVIVYRYSFAEIGPHNLWTWFLLDYLADFLYLVDMAISVRTGFMEDGVMQFNDKRMRVHYMNSTQFYIDCLSLLPLDFLYLSIGYNSMLRVFRLCKVYKFWQFLDRAERHASWPNIMRFAKLMFYYLTILHWNACAFKLVADFMMHRPNPISLVPLTENHVIHTQQTEFDRLNLTVFVANNSGLTYVSAVYWGMMSLISVGTPQPTADESMAYMFKIVECIVGVLLFAAILGHVSNIITNASAGQKEFQAHLDCVKNYLSLRRVPYSLQERVINWFDYLWYTNKITDEENVLNDLPDKLRAEIAIQMHLDTLKRVEIFQNTEEGFLSELVLHLRMVLFAPGDYVCRKGEIGKQMFIVNRGTLHVLGDDNKSVLATLRAGSYFGELSILNLGQYGNRRSASVRSLGYSDLFRLSKSDLWDVLKEYPGARRKLEYHAYKKIHDFKMHRRENGKVQDQFSEHPFPGWGDDLRRLGEAMSTDSITISPHNGEHNCNTSDGYGSDPSRLSAPACCWQQQQQPAIPPVNKHPTARDPVAVPKQVSRPGVDKGNPKVQTVTQYRGQSSGNAAEIFGCRTCQCSQVHSGVQSSPFIPSHNLRHGTFGLEFMSASQNTTRSDLPTNRDLSMPANLVSSVVRTFCTHCISSYSCKNSSVDNSYETCPLHRPLAYTEDAENHPVRFGLGDDPDESAHEAKQENLKEDRVRQEISEPGNNVPAIYFEKASSSSSSCSPISHSAECADTVCTPLQSIPYSLHTAWDSTDFLDLPQTRSSAICTPSKRPPWFGLSRLNNSSNNGIKQLENVCVHKIPPSMLSTDEMGPDGNKYEFMREFARLQQRVYLLEQENFVLKSRQHVQTSFDNVERWTTNVSNKCHTIHERDSSSVNTPNVSVKRSTSLQVPSIRRPYRRHSRPVQRKYATIEAPSDEFDIDSSISDFTETERNPRSY